MSVPSVFAQWPGLTIPSTAFLASPSVAVVDCVMTVRLKARLNQKGLSKKTTDCLWFIHYLRQSWTCMIKERRKF